MAKRLKKQARPVAQAKPKGFVIRMGTRNEFGPVRSYTSSSNAKRAVVDELRSFIPWCQRHNSAGIEEISTTISTLDSAIFTTEHQRVECCFDERYQMWFVAEFWKETT